MVYKNSTTCYRTAITAMRVRLGYSGFVPAVEGQAGATGSWAIFQGKISGHYVLKQSLKKVLNGSSPFSAAHAAPAPDQDVAACPRPAFAPPVASQSSLQTPDRPETRPAFPHPDQTSRADIHEKHHCEIRISLKRRGWRVGPVVQSRSCKMRCVAFQYSGKLGYSEKVFG